MTHFYALQALREGFTPMQHAVARTLIIDELRYMLDRRHDFEPGDTERPVFVRAARSLLASLRLLGRGDP